MSKLTKKRILLSLLAVILMGILAVGGAVGYFVYEATRHLPDAEALAKYRPAVSTRLFDRHGNLVAEFASEKRVFTPIDAMPERLVNAFLAAEDKNFYDHKGLDMKGIARAVFANVGNVAQGRRLEGASTITQQVAKNLLLSNEVSFRRKLREAILAREIEQNFSKEQILELYLNAIFLGQRSYGVTAAARTYFNKPLDELSVAEVAYLAALPKAPSTYHPTRNHDRALARRNWVVTRMLQNGYINEEQHALALEQPLVTRLSAEQTSIQSADYFVEEVRRELIETYGEERVYKDGLMVFTTLDPELQTMAQDTLRQHLETHDRGPYRGGFDQIKLKDDKPDSSYGWYDQLKARGDITPNEAWQVAVVLKTSGPVVLGLDDGDLANLSVESVKWAQAGTGLKVGDLIYAEPGPEGHILRQVPEINGAIVALEPEMGRVRALVGGYSFDDSSFNRATQAWRQPGSAFKPFVYAAALENGYTPATVVMDAPFAAETATGEMYRPENYDLNFLGPLIMRVGIQKSRNAMTVRLAQHVGLETTAKFIRPFEISPKLLPVLSMSLGSLETTPARMAAAYASFANGGLKVRPQLIERIQDREGTTVFKLDDRICTDCNDSFDPDLTPRPQDNRRRLMDSITAYQMTSMMRDVVRRGTATVVNQVGKPIAGKTGTTNDYKDAWFVGFSQDLVSAVFLGYDNPKSLGKGGTGGGMAAPVFTSFMSKALRGVPQSEFTPPKEAIPVWIEETTGLPTIEGYGRLEFFKPGTEPGMMPPEYIGGNLMFNDPFADDPLLFDYNEDRAPAAGQRYHKNRFYGSYPKADDEQTDDVPAAPGASEDARPGPPPVAPEPETGLGGVY